MNDIELQINSPRCFCGELKIDFKTHMMEKHKAIVFYHTLKQMEKLWKIRFEPRNEILKALEI